MISDKERGFEHHVRMVEMIKEQFPKATRQQRRRIQNKTARIISKHGSDVLQAWITPVYRVQAQYARYDSFTVGDIKVYLEMQVD